MSGEFVRHVTANAKAATKRQQRLKVAVAEKPRATELEAILHQLEQDAMQAVRDQLSRHRKQGV